MHGVWAWTLFAGLALVALVQHVRGLELENDLLAQIVRQESVGGALVAQEQIELYTRSLRKTGGCSALPATQGFPEDFFLVSTGFCNFSSRRGWHKFTPILESLDSGNVSEVAIASYDDQLCTVLAPETSNNSALQVPVEFNSTVAVEVEAQEFTQVTLLGCDGAVQVQELQEATGGELVFPPVARFVVLKEPPGAAGDVCDDLTLDDALVHDIFFAPSYDYEAGEDFVGIKDCMPVQSPEGTSGGASVTVYTRAVCPLVQSAAKLFSDSSCSTALQGNGLQIQKFGQQGGPNGACATTLGNGYRVSGSFSGSDDIDFVFFYRCLNGATRASDVFSLLIATAAPTSAPTSSPRGEEEDDGVAPETVALAVVPAALALAGVAYIIVTRRRRKKGSGEHGHESDLQAVAKTLPPGTAATYAGQMSLLGFSVSVLRVNQPQAEDRSNRRVLPGGPHDMVDDDEVYYEEEEEKTSGDFSTSSGGLGGLGVATVLAGAEGANGVRSEYEIRNASEVKLGRLIGTGAHGKVYAGTFAGSEVAVKEFVGPRSLQGFRRELKHLQALQHPNVVRLYGAVASEHASRRLLVLEKAEGSLALVVQRQAPLQGNISVTTLLQWAQQVCTGCAYMHSKGVAHLDVKPANLLLDGSWVVKVADLGEARGRRSLAQHVGVGVGTPAYAAPELLSPSPTRGASTSADVYSFGVVLWQLLHRRPVLPEGWSLVKVVGSVVEDHYRPEIDDALPHEVANMIRVCWASSPEDRPSFAELQADLDALLGAQSASAPRRGPAPFEKGQTVAVWDPAEMRFVDRVTLQRNATVLRGTFLYDVGDGDAEPVPAENLLLVHDDA